MYNALALEILYGGIPSMYYGTEADMEGAGDPYNRGALWEHTDYQGTGESYKRIQRLNQIRNKMGDLGGFHEVIGKQAALTDDDIAFERNGALLVLTNVSAFFL
jgi:alpha-amylase